MNDVTFLEPMSFILRCSTSTIRINENKKNSSRNSGTGICARASMGLQRISSADKNKTTHETEVLFPQKTKKRKFSTSAARAQVGVQSPGAGAAARPFSCQARVARTNIYLLFFNKKRNQRGRCPQSFFIKNVLPLSYKLIGLLFFIIE
jgi:hypothetical protein